jgi:hypothetical protein
MVDPQPHRWVDVQLVQPLRGDKLDFAGPAIAGAGLADYQQAAGYLADTWGCVAVRASNKGRG